MKNSLIDEIVKFIKDTEEKLDEEFGGCRNLQELTQDGEMPELYDRLLKKNFAVSEIKAFCEFVMHPDSDLHKDAEWWIKERLKTCANKQKTIEIKLFTNKFLKTKICIVTFIKMLLMSY